MKSQQRDFYTQEHFRYNTIIDQVVLVGLHDNLKIKHDTHQLKWITNLKIITGKQYEQQSRHGHRENYTDHIKFIEIGNNLFLKIFYCEKDEHPILKLKTAIKTPLNENNVVPYPANINFEECIIFERYQKAEYQRLIQDLEMVQVSGDKELQIPQGQSYEVIRLPIQCQTIPQENSSNQQLIQKTRYLLIKTFDFDDADKIDQFFQSSVKLIHCFKNHKDLVSDSVFHQFCFPLGVQITNDKTKSGYQIFNFILTQQDGDRMYVNCIKFSEKFADQEVEKLPSNFVDKNLHKNQVFYTQQIFCIISRFCYTDFFHDLLQKIYQKFLSVNISKLQKKYKKTDHINLENGSHQDTQGKFINIVKQFIASYQQGFEKAEHTLPQLQVMRQSVRIEMKWFNDIILFPEPNEDNPTNYSSKAIWTLFGVLSVENIMEIMLSILLQRKVLFISDSQMILGHVIQSFISFLYPIQWKHPILPSILHQLIQYLEAPVPLIAGILNQIADDQLVQNLTETTIVFLDCNEIINKDMNMKVKDVNHLREAMKKLKFYQIYSKETAGLILQYQTQYFYYKQADSDFTNRFSGQHVKNIFFQTILLFLQNYSDHYIPRSKQPAIQSPRSSNGGFDFKRHYALDNFVRSHPRSLHKFMEKFILTSHFINFIHKFHKSTFNSHKHVIDKALSMQKNNKSPIQYSKSEQFRYSQQPKINNNEINQLRKKVSLENHRNTTWSPPPKKSEASTNYTQNIDRFSLRLEDVQFERDKSMSNGASSHEKKSRGGNICEAISKVVSQASRTKMLMWTIARVNRLKKKIFGGVIEQQHEKKEQEKPKKMEEQQEKRESKCH